MNLLEFNDECCKKDKEAFESVAVEQEDVDEYHSVLCTGETIYNVWNTVNSARAFYKMYPDVREYFGSKAIELFYTSKLNYKIEGIPAYIVYILQTAIGLHKGTPHPNKILNSCFHLLTNEVKFTYNGLTIDRILAGLISKDVTLLTTAVNKAKDGEVYEVYIKSEQQVAILPKAIGDVLTPDDCDNLKFARFRGILINDVPIRTLAGKLGVTKDDFDLTDCI